MRLKGNIKNIKENIKDNNRGDAMVMVIVVIAFVSILISSLYMLTYTNIQMKSIDLQAKENFYSAEEALEQIQLGLQEDVAGAARIAYSNVVQNYAIANTEMARRTQFTTVFLNDLKDRIQETGTSKYSLDRLNNYLSAEVETYTGLSSSDGNCRIVTDTDSIVLKDLVIEYTNANGYQSVIETDIRLTVPNPNFAHPSDMPDVFEYCIIANKQLKGKNMGSITIEANVYAGEDGMVLPEGTTWSIGQASRLVVAGPLQIAQQARLSGSSDLNVWVKGIQVNGGTMSLSGKTYVADDLLLNNSGSKVTLKGEYYGYGNGNVVSDEGAIQEGGGEYSAILVNGTNSTLDMENVRKLLLSGSAKLTTGSVYHEAVEVELPPGFSNTTPGTSTPSQQPVSLQLQPIRIKEGIYELYSVYAGKMVTAGSSSTDDDYLLHPKTPRESATNKDRYEVIYNNDGTVYFKNVNSNRSVALTTDAELLRANTYGFNINTKFRIYLVINGPDYMKNKFVIQSVANGKYLSVEEGVYGYDYLVAASREEVQGTNSLFELGAVITEPVITVMNEDSKQATFKISYPGITGATLSYNTTRSGGKVSKTMAQFNGKETYYCVATSNSYDNYYTITYKVGSSSSSVKFPYDESRTDTGNAVNPQSTAAFRDGIYAINSDFGYAVIGDEQGSLSFPYEVRFSAITMEDVIILWNNTDGTISFRTDPQDSSQPFYLSASSSGKLVASSKIMGAKEKFHMEFGSSPNYYIIKSAYNGQYVYVDTNKIGNPAYFTDNRSLATKFKFEFLEYTEAVPIETPDGEEAPEIEETPEQGEIVEIAGVNTDVSLGGALEVKSNQIAYLVPKECIGVNEGDTIIGKNPMSADDYARLMTYANDTENYPDFEVVSFTKEVEGLGKTLGDYRTEGTVGYQPIFQTIPGDTTLVYFYLVFDNDNLSRYFRDYYAAYKDTLNGYMNYYVDDIALNNLYSRLTLKGNMVYSEPNVSGGFSIKSNEGVGANLTEEERDSLAAEEIGYQKNFYALSKKLVMDYTDLSSTEKGRDLYHNLIRENALAGLGAGVHTYTSDSGTASAVVVNNLGSSAYVYGSGQPDNICLILANGDVEIQKNFSGIVIAGGTVTINTEHGPCTITPNRDALNTILQTMTNDDVNAETIIEKFFIDGESYVLENTSEAVTGEDVISYSDLITYEGWTKR